MSDVHAAAERVIRDNEKRIAVRIRNAMLLLYVHDIITDAENDKCKKRFEKKFRRLLAAVRGDI